MKTGWLKLAVWSESVLFMAVIVAYLRSLIPGYIALGVFCSLLFLWRFIRDRLSQSRHHPYIVRLFNEESIRAGINDRSYRPRVS
jgi:hypothetical protein